MGSGTGIVKIVSTYFSFTHKELEQDVLSAFFPKAVCGRSAPRWLEPTRLLMCHLAYVHLFVSLISEAMVILSASEDLLIREDNQRTGYVRVLNRTSLHVSLISMPVQMNLTLVHKDLFLQSPLKTFTGCTGSFLFGGNIHRIQQAAF